MLESSGHLLHVSLISVLILLLPLSAFYKEQFLCWEESNHSQLSHQVSEPEQSFFHSWSVTCNHSHPHTPLTHSPLTHTHTPSLTHRDIDMAEFLSSDPAVQDAHPHTVYDLIANICHDGQPGTMSGSHSAPLLTVARSSRLQLYCNIWSWDGWLRPCGRRERVW